MTQVNVVENEPNSNGFSLVRLGTCMLRAGRSEADKEWLEILGNENIFHKYALFT